VAVFRVFRGAPFFAQKEPSALKKGHTRWQLHHSQPRMPQAESFSDWPGKNQSGCLPVPWKEELPAFTVSCCFRAPDRAGPSPRAVGSHSPSWQRTAFPHLQRGEVTAWGRFVFLSIHRKQQMHNPAAALIAFLSLSLLQGCFTVCLDC